MNIYRIIAYILVEMILLINKFIFILFYCLNKFSSCLYYNPLDLNKKCRRNNCFPNNMSTNIHFEGFSITINCLYVWKHIYLIIVYIWVEGILILFQYNLKYSSPSFLKFRRATILNFSQLKWFRRKYVFVNVFYFHTT